jgi:hypothetical protein
MPALAPTVRRMRIAVLRPSWRRYVPGRLWRPTCTDVDQDVAGVRPYLDG